MGINKTLLNKHKGKQIYFVQIKGKACFYHGLSLPSTEEVDKFVCKYKSCEIVCWENVFFQDGYEAFAFAEKYFLD